MNKLSPNLLSNVNMYEILDSVNVGIWIIEYSQEQHIYRLYPNETFFEILGIKNNKDLTPESCFLFWYNRVDKEYEKDIQKTIENMINMYDKDPNGYITDEVCYIWNHPVYGKVNVRCGGKVISKEQGIYKICGYHQDYSDIVKLKDHIEEEQRLKLVEKKIENIAHLKDYYKKLAYVDELTNLENRRGFYYKIESLLKLKTNNKEYQAWLSVLDLDYFKQINDKFGHLSGDKVLCHVANTLKFISDKYKNCYCFRYGGEEFIILLIDVNKIEATEIFEECRVAIKQEAIMIAFGQSIKVTCSMGATYIKNLYNLEDKYDINNNIHKADLALYEAKKTGKDRLIFNI